MAATARWGWIAPLASLTYMTEQQRRELETSLIRSGFKGLNDPELLPEMAKLITNHEVLRALLNECSRMERNAMLQAVKPYLPFEAYDVEWYENRTAEKFEQYEETRRRMIVGDQNFEEVCKELASHVVVTLTCSRCTRAINYAGESPLGAVILARQDGWVREKATNKEVCMKHKCADRSKKQACAGCGRKHYAPGCRVQGTIEPGAPLVGGAIKGELDISTQQVN